VKRIRGVRYAEVSCLPPGEEEKKEEKKDERSKTIRGKSKEEKEREKMKEETVTAFMEAIASVVAPNKQEAKDISKRKKMLDKVTSEISLAVSEGKNEISFRKRALENSHIPKNMGKYMKEVKKLVLSDNKLFFFPVALLEMASLQVLELKNNTLMYLPKELPRMTALKKLDLENNQLRALPGEMGSMTHLEDLRLKGNPLEGFLPPEAMASGTRGVLAYLRDLHKGAERCYRMKLMFVVR
jgi:Leucine-rich repeat (LRR) protein